MRLFVAVDIPVEVKEVLSSLRVALPGVRWVPPEQLHLTLVFLGETEPECLDKLCSALAAIAVPPFTLTFDRTGCFPHPGYPKVLWAGVKHQPSLTRLARAVREAAARCGIQTDERPFSPHITLARSRQPVSCTATGFDSRPISSETISIPVRKFTLYKSSLTQLGAIHEAVREFALLP